MKKQMKTVCCLVAVLVLLFMSMTVSAAGDSVELNRNGSLTITLKAVENNIPLSYAEISIYQVADVTEYNGLLQFTLSSRFAESGISIDNLSAPALAEQFYNYAGRHSLQAVSAVVDEDGSAQLGNLPLGLYLVTQTKSADGYTDFEPFLISIPQRENDTWRYDVVAAPKTGAVRLVDIEVHKVWNDSGKNRPKSVKIQLLKNGQPFETVTLSDQNGWQYRWNRLRSDEEWSVRETDIPKGYTVSYRQNAYIFTVTNVSALAQTGQLNWPVPILICIGLFSLLIGWILYSKQGKKRHA